MPINNIDDLRSEIIRLETLKQEQELVLKPRFSTPSALLHTIMSIFPKSAPGSGGLNLNNFLNQDLIAMASRFIIPFTLNRTLFRRSNFIVRTLVGLLSQKASGYINESTVTTTWDKAKNVFNNIFKKKEKAPVAPVTPPPVEEVIILPPPTFGTHAAGDQTAGVGA